MPWFSVRISCRMPVRRGGEVVLGVAELTGQFFDAGKRLRELALQALVISSELVDASAEVDGAELVKRC
ncbi:hypothetical protein [Streptomyces sp. NPDC101150]|uniref:hypothetical protein n=1 Tax=Streptomyces sp. NPDC101150 TaxID=3366114 RepID=UPI00382CA3A1